MVKILSQNLPSIRVDLAQIELDYVTGIIINGTRMFPTVSQLANFYGVPINDIVRLVDALDLESKRQEYINRLSKSKTEYIETMKNLSAIETHETASYMRSLLRNALRDQDPQAILVFSKLAAMWTELSLKIEEQNDSDMNKWKEIWQKITSSER